MAYSWSQSLWFDEVHQPSKHPLSDDEVNDRRCPSPPEFCTLPKFLGGEGHSPIGHLTGILKVKSNLAFAKVDLIVFFAFLQVENAIKFAFAKAITCHVKSYNTPKLMIFVRFGAL